MWNLLIQNGIYFCNWANYKEQDYIDILKHSSFDYKTEQEIKIFMEHNLKSLDNIYIEKGEKNDWGIK